MWRLKPQWKKADFNIRAYHPQKGNNPKILTRKKEEAYGCPKNGRKPVYEDLALRKYTLYGNCAEEAKPFSEPIRTKQVITPAYSSSGGVNFSLGSEEGAARKVIRRAQPGTNNKTNIAFDYIPDEKLSTGYSHWCGRDYGCTAVEIARDLKDGDVLEFTAKQANRGKVVTLDRLALRSGKAIEDIPQFLNSLKNQLDPLAKNWLRKAMMHIV